MIAICVLKESTRCLERDLQERGGSEGTSKRRLLLNRTGVNQREPSLYQAEKKKTAYVDALRRRENRKFEEVKGLVPLEQSEPGRKEGKVGIWELQSKVIQALWEEERIFTLSNCGAGENS